MRALAGIGAATLTLHAALLSGLEWAWPGQAPAWRQAPLQVRVVAVDAEAGAVGTADERSASIDAAAATPAPASVHLEPALKAAPERAARRATPTQAPRPATPAQAHGQGQGEGQSGEEREGRGDEEPEGRSERSGAAEAPRGTPASTATEAPTPLYRTRRPPAATLRYAMSRGPLRMEAELQWRPSAEGYTLRLVGSGARSMVQSSHGEFDAAGLAPLRYTDERAGRSGRSVLAVNFRRELGKISFSGSGAELPWVAGSQDRLSWMIQLAAVLAAEPERGAAGARLALPVVGVRGDAGMWVFRSLGVETLNTDAELLSTLKLVRESVALHDPEVTVWVDPARHYLPVRIVQGTGDAARTFELMLRDLVITP